MDAQQTKRLQTCIQEISEILYQNTPIEKLTTEVGHGTSQGKVRTLKRYLHLTGAQWNLNNFSEVEPS